MSLSDSSIMNDSVSEEGVGDLSDVEQNIPE